MDTEDQDEAFNYLLETGSIYPRSENGDIVFYVNAERCQEFAPWYWDVHVQSITKAALDLVDKGVLDFDIDPDTLETSYTITEQGKGFLDL